MESKFEQSQKDVRTLKTTPPPATLLKLYALFKQGSVGDVSGDRPGRLQFKERAKFDAWAELKGLSKEEAQKRYVDLVESLLK